MKLKSSGRQISSQVVDEASAWFVEFRLGEVDAAARERFIEWLRASPLHIRAYLEVAGTYAEMAPPHAKVALDIESLIAEARSEPAVIELPRAKATSAAVRRSGARFLALAASLVLLVAGTWFWNDQVRDTYRTQIGEQRSLTLADGSRIDMNARSRIRVRLSGKERRIELLGGQALFHVARDSTRPFVVRAAETTVRAVGTSFDVNRGRGGTTVTVLEGRVEITDARKPGILLSAGEQVRVSVGAPLQARPVDADEASAWTQHKLVFEGTPLQDVVEQFNRYNARQIVIEGHELENFRVSGYYASPDPASLLNFLRTEQHIEVIESRDSIRIVRK